VLLDEYKANLVEIETRFPGGKTVEGPFSISAQGPSFVAYEAP
jgi:hypothetical protein